MHTIRDKTARAIAEQSHELVADVSRRLDGQRTLPDESVPELKFFELLDAHIEVKLRMLQWSMETLVRQMNELGTGNKNELAALRRCLEDILELSEQVRGWQTAPELEDGPRLLCRIIERPVRDVLRMFSTMQAVVADPEPHARDGQVHKDLTITFDCEDEMTALEAWRTCFSSNSPKAGPSFGLGTLVAACGLGWLVGRD